MARTKVLLTILRLLTLAGACLLTSNLGRTEEKAEKNPFLGCWQGEDGTLVRFEAERATVFDKQKKLSFYQTKYASSGKAGKETSVHLHAPLDDADGKVQLQVQGDVLIIEKAGILPKSKFRKLNTIPSDLELKPMKLGKAKPLSDEKVEAIKEELARRAEVDQEIRKGDNNDPAERAKAIKQDRDNIDYVIKLVQEVGWIDAERFGNEAPVKAMLLVQHSANLPLMAATMPEIEKDIKAGKLAFTAVPLYPLMVYRFLALQAKEMSPEDKERLKEIGIEFDNP